MARDGKKRLLITSYVVQKSSVLLGRRAHVTRFRYVLIRRARGYLDVDRLVAQGLQLGEGAYLSPSV